ncbi:MAG: sporulation initiation factor Spo0A C-terminal domain-containing protein [Oscillospiraceae bacterium]|nr:sporulation initiation factor Spo0A C-terminal domain-containing protein [Oscillospiraceae bacterium]
MTQKQTRVLVADIGDAFATVSADLLRKLGIWAFTRPQTPDDLMQGIRTEHPDRIIFNFSAVTMDIQSFIRQLSSVSDIRCIAFLGSGNPYLERMLTALKIPCLLQPDDLDQLSELLGGLCGAETQPDAALQPAEASLLDVTALLHDCSIPVHMNGFHYLRSAILYRSSSPDRNKITQIYSAVASEYAVTAKQVERSIRNAINQAWAWRENNRDNSIYSLCRCANIPEHKPTNSEFVALASDWLRLKAAHNSGGDSRFR